MSKKELAEQIAEQFTDVLTKARAEEITTFIFDKMKENLSKGKEVAIPGFGKFTVAERAARNGRNPATGEAIQIKAAKAAKFKPAKQLKDTLNGN